MELHGVVVDERIVCYVPYSGFRTTFLIALRAATIKVRIHIHVAEPKRLLEVVVLRANEKPIRKRQGPVAHGLVI